MIAALGKILAGIGLSWLGNLVLAWDRNRQSASVDAALQAGANRQIVRDVTTAADAQGRIAQAEAEADRTQAGMIDAAKRGEF